MWSGMALPEDERLPAGEAVGKDRFAYQRPSLGSAQQEDGDQGKPGKSIRLKDWGRLSRKRASCTMLKVNPDSDRDYPQQQSLRCYAQRAERWGGEREKQANEGC